MKKLAVAAGQFGLIGGPLEPAVTVHARDIRVRPGPGLSVVVSDAVGPCT